VRNLKARIECLERRFAVVEDPEMYLDDLLHELKLTNPEEFRREPADRRDSDKQHILNSPTPKHIIRKAIREGWRPEPKGPAPSSARTCAGGNSEQTITMKPLLMEPSGRNRENARPPPDRSQ
jgi:hypothetical protein